MAVVNKLSYKICPFVPGIRKRRVPRLAVLLFVVKYFAFAKCEITCDARCEVPHIAWCEVMCCAHCDLLTPAGI